jgi:hypothetical protein
MTRPCRISPMGRSRRFFRLLVAALSVLLPAMPQAQAQNEAQNEGQNEGQSEAQQEVTWYAIEVIVFERASEGGRDAELWPAEPGLPDIAGAVELSDRGLAPQQDADESQSGSETAVAAETDGATPPATLPFQLVPPEEYRLTDLWASLDKSSAYRPLLHIAWIQPGVSSEQAQLIHVRNNNAALGTVTTSVDESQPAFSEPGYAPTLSSRIQVARDPSKAALDGTLRVHRARYLHVQADLLYYRPLDSDVGAALPSADNAGAAPFPDSPDTALIEQLLADEDAAPRLFRLTENSRMRSRELHYLDHPLFGMLVEAWPVELPEAPEVTPETALQGQGAETTDESGAGQPLPAATQSGSGG